jgi:GNAT superfamily N-acetyltransferase
MNGAGSKPAKFTIELATPAAGPEVFDLFHQFEFVSSDLDEATFTACWRDQFFGSLPGSGCVFLARDEGGRLVGHFGALPFPYVVNGATACGGFVCQLFVHPDFRGTPLFPELDRTLLTRHQEFGLSFLYGAITRKHALRALLNNGFSRGTDFHIYALPLAPGAGLRAVKPGTPQFLVAALNRMGSLACRAGVLLMRSARTTLAIEEVLDWNRLDPDVFSHSQLDSGTFALRSPELYRIRFRQFGQKRYRIFAAVSGAKHQGYIVLRRTTINGFDVMAVVELAAPPNSEAARSLIMHAALQGTEDGCDTVACLARPGSSEARTLCSCLFWRTPAHFTLIAERNSPIVQSGPGWANRWKLTWFDHDFI